MKMNCRFIYRISSFKGFYTVASICLLATAFCSCLPAHAATQSDSLFTDTIFFHKSSAIINYQLDRNAEAIQNIRHFIFGAGNRDSLGIDIFGYASPEGSVRYNESLARQRAEALQNTIKPYTDVIPSIRWGVAPTGPLTEWSRQRYASISIYRHSPQQQDNHTQLPPPFVIDSISVKYCNSRPVCNYDPINNTASFSDLDDTAGRTATQTGTTAHGIKFFLGTNLLYDAALTPSISVGVHLGSRFSVCADWMYAWWSNRDRRRYWRVYGGGLEARFRLGRSHRHNPFAGHHIGLYASIVTYDFQFGRDHVGVIGDKYNYAAGLSYGYTLPVAKRLDIDFSIGLGYMWGRYMKHTPVDNHDVWMSTHNLGWIGPTRAEIGLHWLIGPDNKNVSKGGRR